MSLCQPTHPRQRANSLSGDVMTVLQLFDKSMLFDRKRRITFLEDLWRCHYYSVKNVYGANNVFHHFQPCSIVKVVCFFYQKV